MIMFFILFENFWNFFQISWTPGGPWGGAKGRGGAPPMGGTPHGYLLIMILIFYVSGIFFYKYLGITSKKNGTDQTSGVPQADWGGVLGGCIALGDPRGSVGPVFFA